MILEWRSSCRTDVGKVRRINEDACLAMPEVGFWLVADGVGGHSAGDVASRIVLESFGNMKTPSPIQQMCYDARIRLFEANRRIREEAGRMGADVRMGSTVVLFLTRGRDCVCLWAGDSRAYLWRAGLFTQITHDHTVTEELVRGGSLRREDSANHAQSHVLTRALGADENLVLDENLHGAEHGDKIVLCSDGLNKEMTDEEIAAVVGNNDCDEACEQLIETSLARGARDNVTVAVIEFSNPEDSTIYVQGAE
jgi:serine/threonine protein phosphatase PrpC